MTAGTESRRPHIALILAVALVAFDLRPAITAVSPVLPEIQRATGMSSAEAGLLTSVPVLAFGACAPFAPALSRRLGMEGAIAWSLALAAIGLLVRVDPGIAPLFLGTLAAGVAIAICNVLAPALVKRDFREHSGLGMGVYSVALSGGAAIAAGTTVPLMRATGIGWRGGIALWAAPAALGAVVWATRRARPVARELGSPWRDPLAWQVTAFMGLQSVGYYSLVAWIPTIFEQHGIHAAPAGWLLSLSGLASLPSAFLTPMFASSPARQRAAVLGMVVLNAVALGGLIAAPVAGADAWMILLGIAQGSAISLAMHFIAERTPTPDRAAELSGMAQCVGYLVASAGPFCLGALRDLTGSWTAPLALAAAVLVPQLVSGLRVSRPTMVGTGAMPTRQGGSPAPH